MEASQENYSSGLLNLRCCICKEIISEPITLGCSHTMDVECIFRAGVKNCPECNAPIVDAKKNPVVRALAAERNKPQKILEIFCVDTR